MTDDDLAALRAECERLKAATPSGRWTHSRYRNENGWWSSLVLEDGERARIDSILTLLTTPVANQEGGGDVVEIACRLRNALPAICAALARAEAAEREVERLRAGLHDALADDAKYPQLRLHQMHRERLERLLAAPATGGERRE